jgi:phospholipid transport system substrate-binding protein
MSSFARTIRAGAIALAASLLLTVTGGLSAPMAAYAQAASAKDFVQKLGDDAIKQLTDKTIPDNERVKRMRALLHASFDEALVSKFVLGTSWAKTNDDQRAEFQKLYEIVVAHNYAGLFKRYSGQTFQVLNERTLDATTTVVNAQINQTDGAPAIPVELQVDKEDSGWKATDIKVDGVSMPQTHRKEYASVINRSRNGVDGLLEAMRAKAKQLEADEPSE